MLKHSHPRLVITLSQLTWDHRGGGGGVIPDQASDYTLTVNMGSSGGGGGGHSRPG